MASDEVTGRSSACEDAAALLPDAWAGTLDEEGRRRLEAHLSTCDACRTEATALADTWDRLDTSIDAPPSEAMRQRFTATLAAYAAGERDAHEPRAVLVAGNTAGTLSGRFGDARAAAGPERPRASVAMRSMAAVAAAALIGMAFLGGMLVNRRQTAPNLDALHHEVQTMRQMLALSLLQQQSANERLRGLSVTAQLDRPDDAVLTALVATLASDPNVNVRLSAVDALKSFGAEVRVRDGLLDALPRQQSPLVQIALIDSLVDMGERRAVGVFRRLAVDEQANQAVRARAAEALQQLS
ncbi:MAG: HEAT repeat domain-containing protein [Vicinamibacterales bacterium]